MLAFQVKCTSGGGDTPKGECEKWTLSGRNKAVTNTVRKVIGFNLAEVFRIIRRHKVLILGTIVLLLASTITYILCVKPRYAAESQIFFESKAGAVFDYQAAVAGQPRDEASIVSEIEVIKSRNLAERVIAELHLDQYPEFNESLRPTYPLVDFLKANLPSIDQTGGRDSGRQRVIEEFRRRIQAELVPRSRTVIISFVAEDPELAAQTLNTLVEQNFVARLEDRFANAATR